MLRLVRTPDEYNVASRAVCQLLHEAEVTPRPGDQAKCLVAGKRPRPLAAPRRMRKSTRVGCKVIITLVVAGCGTAVEPATTDTNTQPLGDAATLTNAATLVNAATLRNTASKSRGRHLSAKTIRKISKAAKAQVAEDDNGSGYSVAVWHDGQVVYSAGFGARDEQGHPVTSDTLFQIGSDTKKITAIAILQEVEKGNLALTSTLAEVVPGLALAKAPSAFDVITVEDLLTHRSGLFDYTPWVNEPEDEQLEGAIWGRFADNEYTLMPPGIAHNYSNPNYSLLGYIDEVLTHRAWADVVKRRVLEPLGMRHTHARLADALSHERNIASGFGLGSEVSFDTFDGLDVLTLELPDFRWVAPTEQPDDAFIRPAGLVWSTAADQARLLGFLIDGDERILSDELREQMSTLHAPEYDHAEWGYGYGVYTSPYYVSADGNFYAERLIYHGGNALTMSSASWALPDQRVAVAVLSNVAFHGGADTIAQATLEAVAGDLGEPLVDLELLPPPAEDLSAYAGLYSDPNFGDVSISLQDGVLTLSVPKLEELGLSPTTELVPEALDMFTIMVGDEYDQISFYPDATGAPAYGVHRDFVFTRK